MKHASSQPTLREWLSESPFSLAMSSGFFSFFAHTGVLLALEDEGLLPARVSGSSAGALVTSLWASGVDAPALANELMALTRHDFWDPSIGLGLLRGQLFRERLDRLTNQRSFSAARRPVAVSVHDVLGRKTEVLKDGSLAAAAHASCAVPVLFHPVRIGTRLYVDGGVSDRPGLAGMPAGERVLFHHIVSRSPWRMAVPSSLRMPSRPNMLTLAIDSLPRSGPFKLDVGREALWAARTAMVRALKQPVANSMVRVTA